MTVYAQFYRQLSHSFQQLVINSYLRQQLAGSDNFFCQLLLCFLIACNEAFSIVFIRQTAFDYLYALQRVMFAGNNNAQTKAVQKLRADVTLFGVHSAYQNKACGVGVGNALAFNSVYAHGSGVQQHVYNVVIQQVDFIYI